MAILRWCVKSVVARPQMSVLPGKDNYRAVRHISSGPMDFDDLILTHCAFSSVNASGVKLFGVFRIKNIFSFTVEGCNIKCWLK